MTETPDSSPFWDASIFVVDDNEANTAVLNQVLLRAGFSCVRVINDPREVPGLLAEAPPDLILLDLHMPHLDGYQLLDVIANYAAGQFLPVLVLTADTTQEATQRALKLGAHDFLTKPFNVIEVTLRVNNLLRTRMLYRELRRSNRSLREDLAGLDIATLVRKESRQVKFARVDALLADGRTRMVFQPIVDFATQRTVGYEALARFNGEPARGPDQWFAEAAEVGLGVELEMQAIRAALAQLPLLEADQFMSINASPATVLAGMVPQLGDGVPWDRIVIELTEHSAIEDYDVLCRDLKTARDAGARIAIDDTGAGYASLRHILNLEPDLIKLDISICRNIDRDPARSALATALTSFAGDIGALVIAEGIETPAEHQTLLQLGAHYGQGYHLGRPAPLTLAP